MTAEGKAEASAAAVVALEQELDRAIEAFALDYERLIRSVCLESDAFPVQELALTILFGHTLRRLVESRGRAATERLALAMTEQLAAVIDVRSGAVWRA